MKKETKELVTSWFNISGIIIQIALVIVGIISFWIGKTDYGIFAFVMVLVMRSFNGGRND